MPTAVRPHVINGLLLCLTASIVCQIPAHGQTDARVALRLTQVPELSELWPADFNRDGITDLVANRSTGNVIDVVVEIGHGDGTFDAPRRLNLPTSSSVVGIGDLNGDGLVDILTTTPTAGSVSPGNGDGTFGTAVPLAFRLGPPTYVADMNDDRVPDLVTTNGSTTSVDVTRVLIYPGRGNFTFGPSTSLTTGLMTFGITVADFNGDGLLDVAANSDYSKRIDVFMNQGSFIFLGTSIPLTLNGGGLTARDIDGDGVIDLIAGTGQEVTDYWKSGFINVFHGNGDGTFQAAASYPVNVGPVMVVAGDFNGDGIQDLASGNRSAVIACDSIDNLWDSVSILVGRGDGTFAPAQSFALGDSENLPDRVYRRSVRRLNTSDLDADGRTDLLVSPGAILLMQPAGENHPPVANAGPDVTIPGTPGFDDKVLRGSATDADADWLTFEWRDDLGRVYSPGLPQQCHVSTTETTRIYTLTVRDGQGGVSSDSMRLTFSFPTPLPNGTASTDIGSVAASFDAYSSTQDRYIISGSGADIWGTSDAFHYVYAPVNGDFDVSTLVTAVENIDLWTKAGLMIRESLSPSSRHTFVFATPTVVNGTAFQRRVVEGGESIHTPGPSVASPVWIRLLRQGDTITAFTRVATTDAWAMVDTQTLPGLADPVYVGLAVTSHAADKVATATFGNYSLVGLNNSLPAGWQNADVGTVAATGSGFGGSGGNFTVAGSGADIWDTADAFHFTFTRWPADGKAVVHVANFDARDPWSKAGLMIRTSLDPAAAQQFLLVSGQNGSAYQRRSTAGAPTLHTEIQGMWFLIQRSGGTLHLWYSNDGASPTRWEPLPDATFPTGEALIGLAVTSHADGQLATATFDHVSVTAGPTPPAMIGGEVGAVGIIGSDSFNGTAYTVSGSGADIWDTVDAFHFVVRQLPSNGTIIARVASLNGPDPWSKAGVMIRADGSASSPHAFMLLSQANGLAFQRRTTAGGITTHTAGPMVGAPQWVRLTRIDNIVTAAYSSDGQTWIDLGQDTLPIGTGPVRVGLAVTSHDNNALATAVFDNVLLLP